MTHTLILAAHAPPNPLPAHRVCETHICSDLLSGPKLQFWVVRESIECHPRGPFKSIFLGSGPQTFKTEPLGILPQNLLFRVPEAS